MRATIWEGTGMQRLRGYRDMTTISKGAPAKTQFSLALHNALLTAGRIAPTNPRMGPQS